MNAVDGTKVQMNASRDENLDYEQLAREIVEEAKGADAAEDELYGQARGDERPPEFATAQGRARAAPWKERCARLRVMVSEARVSGPGP